MGSVIGDLEAEAQIANDLRADGGTRTRNLLLTRQLLCQLSYIGDFPVIVPI
jgi:hypothetical protein